MSEQITPNPIARRRFLRNVFSGAVAGGAMAGVDVALPRPLQAQTPLTPDAALRELMSGNERFDNNQLTSVEHDLRILKENTVEKQEPFAYLGYHHEWEPGVHTLFLASGVNDHFELTDQQRPTHA